MKDNKNKYYLMWSTGHSNQIQIWNSLVKNSFCKTFLDVRFYHNLTLINTTKTYVKKEMQNWQGYLDSCHI